MNINPFKTFRVLVTRYYESIRKSTKDTARNTL